MHESSAEASLGGYFAARTGRLFEALGGGGDRPATRFAITAEDVVAVQMLSVRVPAKAAARLLKGDLGRQMTELLVAIRTDVRISPAVSVIRVLDVLLWMRHQAEHRAHATLRTKEPCPGFGTVSLDGPGQ